MKSLLFIPANTPSMLQNADIFEADAIIFDLEDAINILEKDAARDLLNQYFKRYQTFDMKIIVRINDYETPYYIDDIESVVTWPIDMIMLPKASMNSIAMIDEVLSKFERKLKREKIELIPIIEKAKSLFEIDKIASHPRVNSLLLGGEDLATDLDVERTKEGIEILYARQTVIYAAKAYGKEAIDTPWTHINDRDGLLYELKYVKMLGMTAKACIHPIQIDDVNLAFYPTEKQIAYAKRVIEAEKQALSEGKGVFSVDGKMVDKPIIDRAKNLLKKVNV